MISPDLSTSECDYFVSFRPQKYTSIEPNFPGGFNQTDRKEEYVTNIPRREFDRANCDVSLFQNDLWLEYAYPEYRVPL